MTSTSPNELHLETVLPTDGDSLRPKEIPAWLKALSRLLLRLMGWQLHGQLPNIDKFILPAAYHTSNWDGFIMLLTAWSFGVKPTWMVKAELTRGAFGWIVKAAGGLPIDRRTSRDAVQQAVDLIHQAERIVLVISPEGTRKKTNHWKTGFYWIGNSAGIPFVLGFLDYKYKRCGVGLTIHPTGDINADIEQIWAFYRQTNARYPEKTSDMWLRPAHQRDPEKA